MSSEEKDQEDKTEEPTAKRLEEARGRGQVAKSREFNSFVMLLVGAALIVFMGPSLADDLLNLFIDLLLNVHNYSISDASYSYLFGEGITTLGQILSLFLLFFVVGALLANLVQNGLIISIKPMEPQLSRISLLKNLKQKMGANNFIEFIKGILKIIAVFIIGGILLIPVYERLELFLYMTLPYFMSEMLYWMAIIFMGTLLFMLAISFLDMIYQRLHHRKQLRMTKQEIKEEYKNMEGDPHVKARLNKIRMQRARTRMMDSVPDADVVITNPTHYAVVLKYDQETMMAPVMVAKGADYIALKIREVATENGVAIVENPPLSRGLYATMEIDDEIPEEHFQAVAEVINYIWGLNNKAA